LNVCFPSGTETRRKFSGQANGGSAIFHFCMELAGSGPTDGATCLSADGNPNRAAKLCPTPQRVTQFIDKVIDTNGTLEKEEGPPGLGGPPSTCGRTCLSAEPATSRATAEPAADKSCCRCADDNAASVALASQTPISPSSMPAFPALHSGCHRRRNPTQMSHPIVRPVNSQGRGWRVNFLPS
jgi:hypothetical protein